MTPGKRLFDLAIALPLAVVLAPVMAIIAALMLATEGRPVLYRSERMRSVGRSFLLVKLRTMPVGSDRAGGATGGDKTRALSGLQRFLRRSRVDEVPQLWNVIRGDMSLVGPRPPLREYVAAYPALYGRVLQCRPGVTGLATLLYHRHEERLLAHCRTVAESDAIYRQRCIPRKARLDLIYQKRRTVCFDVMLLARTAVAKIVGK